MKKLLVLLLLSGCGANTQILNCNDDPIFWKTDKCDNEHEYKPKPRPKPEITDPIPGVVVDPVEEPTDKPVCDGGARACRDGEQPTGTESDPTKYIRS